ncbi:MAG: UDP-N-acetylmuramoyl-L-alanyl-D-glutamate--2,6-diaminopimelate ligase [Fimbriimonadaceae bacterium]|nr:UDP-N-acetylmuramoyl-L-alanyl-D-glutamate--2,6-diaminopimelate ligase [Fimbriimonadaceae bacterium]
MSQSLGQWAKSLAPELSLVAQNNKVVSGVTASTANVQDGDLFVCMPSLRRDTHEFLPEAASKGAVAAVVHQQVALDRAAQLGLDAVFVPALPKREFMGSVAAFAHAILGHPAQDLRIYGVTGTNGKTSTATFLQQALSASGEKSAYLGTLGYGSPGGEMETLANTTPFPVEMAQLLARAVSEGASSLTMEASSHALEENRLADCSFDVSVFTNLSQDHLDFHGSMEAYAAAKLRLFTEWAEIARSQGKSPRFALNLDDPITEQWLSQVPGAMTFGRGSADLRIEPISVAIGQIELLAFFEGKSARMRLPVGGQFNVDNAGAALAALVAGGMELARAAECMSEIQPVRGRFEPVPNDLGIGVLVDYAHTPDAIEKLLASAREVCDGRIITVFGCGGDRDRAKRPLMAAAARRSSDVVVVTSDNPRTEDPERILDDVVAGLDGQVYERIVDRRVAIQTAVDMAEQGDVVVIAGKGHEDYQIIGHTKFPMDDVQIARGALEAKA